MNGTTERPPARRGQAARPGRAKPSVEVLLCGSTDRGDDGAALATADYLRRTLPSDVQVRAVGQVDVDDLLAIGPGAGVVIVDAATGIEPGAVLELPIRGLVGQQDVLRPRSSHALTLPEVIGVAEMIRGRPLVGRIVVIGARSFRLGHPLTTTVAQAIPALARAVESAVAAVRSALTGTDRPALPGAI